MLLLAALIGAGLLGYFRLLARAYFAGARRSAAAGAAGRGFRPHFLFNSLNAVLALIRRDPKRAERSLEDLADPVPHPDCRTRASFVRLEDEIALLERYAEIEQLRLGERLRVTLGSSMRRLRTRLLPGAGAAAAARETPVYHGVEPGTTAGEVLVRIERRGDRVAPARIENPYGRRAAAPPPANRMALENIRERLALFFDGRGAHRDAHQRWAATAWK